MKLALIQMASPPGQLQENVATACQLVDQAASKEAGLLVLPEFWSTGYFPLFHDYGYYDLADGDDGLAITAIKMKARERPGRPRPGAASGSPSPFPSAQHWGDRRDELSQTRQQDRLCPAAMVR